MLRARVLLVEDEGLVAMDLEQTLTRMGYRVVGTADDAADAVARARELSPDLVLMDIRLAGPRDGIDAGRELADRFDLPVVFVTGTADPATLERALGSAQFGYVRKPIDPLVLQATIETALGRAHAEQRLRRTEHWLGTALRCLPDAVLLLDGEGRVAYLNPAAEGLVGCSSPAALGRPFADVVALTPALVDGLIGALQVHDPLRLAPHSTLRRADGSTCAVEGSVAPLIDESGSAGSVVLLRSPTPA